MAKPDMPYGLFPFVVPSGSTTSGALAVDLATALKWYWRVRQWTATIIGSFSLNVTLADSLGGSEGAFPDGTSNITLNVGMSAVETFDVLSPTYGIGGLAGIQDELNLCLTNTPPVYLGQYQWIYTGPTIIPCSGTITVADSLGFTYGPASPGFNPSSSGVSRTMFCPGYSNPPNIGGWRHMTRDPSSGLFTPYLGDGDGSINAPLWLGGAWGQLQASIPPSASGPSPYTTFFGGVQIDIQPTASFPISAGSGGSGFGSGYNGNQGIPVAGLVDSQPFTATGFVEWQDLFGANGRTVTGVTYPGGGSISLVIEPALYWTYIPRVDPDSNPTYDSGTGKIAVNPATGEQWTIQEIISRHGP